MATATVTGAGGPGDTVVDGAPTAAKTAPYDGKGRLLFENHPTPFGFAPEPGGAPGSPNLFFHDADGVQISEQTFAHWKAAGQPDASKAPPPRTTGNPTGNTGGIGGVAEVSDQDVRSAWQQYQDAINRGTMNLANTPVVPPPRPLDLATPVQAAQVSPAERLVAARQEAVKVGAIDTADLAATAAGRGAGQDVAAASRRLANIRSQQQAQGLIQQARGTERKGARLQQLQQLGDQNIATEDKVQQENAQARQAAQVTLANISAQKQTVQAQLDQARAAGDQAAINAAQEKMADLDQRAKEVNVQETNKVAGENVDRSLTAQTNQESQRVENERLKIDIQKMINDSAQGLLSEAQRQQNLAHARQQLDLAEREFAAARTDADRQFAAQKRQQWLGLISALVGGATTVAAASIGAPK